MRSGAERRDELASRVGPVGKALQNIHTVLIAEDNLELLLDLKEFLVRIGLKVLSAPDGRAATHLLQSQTVDLLITDFRMPEMDGVELLQWCREQKLHLPVVFLSADAELLEKEKVALGDCCATLMMKPFNAKVLRAAIEAADERSHHRDCLHSRSSPVSLMDMLKD